MAASFSPYGLLAWVAALLLLLAGGRGRLRWTAAPVGLGLIAHSLVVLPYLPGTEPAHAARQPTLTVLALNLRFGQADLEQLAAAVDRDRPDVVVLTEVTRSNAKEFEQRTWRDRLPHRLGTAGRDYNRDTGTGDASGTMVLSRLPLTELGRTDGTAFTNLAAELDHEGRRLVLVAAHPANPTRSVRTWLCDGQQLALLAASHVRSPLIVAGDLNATAEHLTLRNLRARTGLVDAAAGHGWHPTYPAGRWFPPLIGIDHVLVSEEFTTVGYETVQIEGTDHLGVLARLSVR